AGVATASNAKCTTNRRTFLATHFVPPAILRGRCVSEKRPGWTWRWTLLNTIGPKAPEPESSCIFVAEQVSPTDTLTIAVNATAGMMEKSRQKHQKHLDNADRWINNS